MARPDRYDPSAVTPAPETNGQRGPKPPAPVPAQAGSLNRNTAKAEAKLGDALAYLTRLNESSESRSDKWVIN